jgi:4'-phosphopantetheinyl transferase
MPTDRMILGPNEIHLWIARDEQIGDPELLDLYHGLLEPEEQQQQRRFHFERHRHQYLVARALVRWALSLYVEAVAPQQWRFEKNRYGKPAIRNPLPRPLCFNLSHTEQMVVLAVAAGGELGVDVEWLHRRGDTIGIADHYFSPLEVYQLHQLPVAAQRERFFDFWTLKEAYIKACGMGLSIPLHQFSYLIGGDGLVDIVFEAERQDRPELWQFWRIAAGAGHKVALAYRHGAARIPHTLAIRQAVPLRGFEPAACSGRRSLPPLT